ncbi:hypothetical protein APUTEX25_004224 [Auxenochlorella protothecoides]|nr:hypothetical protein APUTEX25_004224 [Auxenochlorella protothecoides]|eukprot:RMZ57390.1 hypothetical protein APUTEX25_004224 [Auxenochlorella protothecoides]
MAGQSPTYMSAALPEYRAKLPAFSVWPGRAKVALQTGAYIGLAGLLLFAKPGLFPIIFETEVARGYVRVGATLAVLFGAYYLGAACDDAAGRPPLFMYAATVAGRGLLSVAFCWLVWSGQCAVPLLWLAGLNALSAARLLRALIRPDGAPAG